MHASVRIRRYELNVKDFAKPRAKPQNPGFQHRGHREKRRKTIIGCESFVFLCLVFSSFLCVLCVKDFSFRLPRYA
jgi:hypothetical protein